MTQHDYNIANQTALASRSDMNTLFQAIAEKNSGATAPTTTFANMWWYETDTNLLKIRNEANTAWVNIAYIDQSGSRFGLIDDAPVYTSAGTEVGKLGSFSESDWETGTETIEALIAPDILKAVVEHHIVQNQLFTTVTDVTGSRTHNTSYQNTTGKPMMVAIVGRSNTTGSNRPVRTSPDNSTWTEVSSLKSTATGTDSSRVTIIVPNGFYYDILGTAVITSWAEIS